MLEPEKNELVATESAMEFMLRMLIAADSFGAGWDAADRLKTGNAADTLLLQSEERAICARIQNEPPSNWSPFDLGYLLRSGYQLPEVPQEIFRRELRSFLDTRN